ncbi:hypothetical protein NMG60_11030328 [Bertholletia excelsa]
MVDKCKALFSRKKSTSRPFKDYYAEFIEDLRNTDLPLLRRSMAAPSPAENILAAHVEAIHRRFQGYYDALDLAAVADVAPVMFPEWRNALERPFLWLGDLHPYLFMNLLRSFLEEKEEEEDKGDRAGVKIGIPKAISETPQRINEPWHMATAWNSPSKFLRTRVEQIECGLRLMVPALASRARTAQASFAQRVGAEWRRCEERNPAVVAGAAAAEMEELAGVLVDANRLRRSVLADIISATTVYQAALFLEALAQFFVGFRDKELLQEFQRSKLLLN